MLSIFFRDSKTLTSGRGVHQNRSTTPAHFSGNEWICWKAPQCFPFHQWPIFLFFGMEVQGELKQQKWKSQKAWRHVLGELGSVKSFWLLRELSPATNLKIYDKLGFLSIENLLKRFITKKLKNILFQRVPPPFPRMLYIH